MEVIQDTLSTPIIKKKMPKWLRLVIIFAVIAALIYAGFFTYKKMTDKPVEQKTSTYTVKRGNVSVEISGSGSIEAIDQYEVKALVKGEILAAPFEEGDVVEKDTLLYTIDMSDVENSIEKAENSLTKAQMTYDEAVENFEDLVIYSDISGVVTEVFVGEGDNISNGGKVMSVKDTNTLVLEIPFLAHEAEQIYVGNSAAVTLDNSYYTIDGTVKRVSGASSISGEGVEVKTVEISVKNPGAVSEGDRATAMIGNIACNASGTFKCNSEKTIIAKASGEIIYMPYLKGDMVYSGDKVLEIDKKQAEKNLLNAQISLNDAKLSLENQREQLDDYNIKAPISGTVIKKTSKAGDSIDTGSNQTVMAVIADMSKMVFEISVDELDISKVKVGQKVDITADALEAKRFEGVVDYISIIGTTQNGVTSYPVRIEVLNPESLIPGMNVTANIVVESRENVICVPVSAIQRGNMVLVKEDSTRKQGIEIKTPDGKAPMQMSTADSVPEGFIRVPVALGINNDEYIEITDGLSEGDVVVVTAAISTNMNMMMPGMGGMMGGPMGVPMGGGMPGGGR